MIQEDLRCIAAITGRNKFTRVLKTFYVSDKPLNTSPLDPDVPNEPFRVCLDQAGNDTRAMFSPGSTQGVYKISRSVIGLSNKNGLSYAMGNYVFAGYPVEVRIGPTSSDVYADHVIVATGVCDVPKISTTSWETGVLDAKDPLSQPLQKVTYTGVGDLEGATTGLAGKEKPLQYGGPSLRVSAPCVDAGKNIYQVASNGVFDIPTAQDRGVELVHDGFYATQDDLLNDLLEPPSGHYKVYKPTGMFRTHGDTAAEPTCTVLAGATVADRSAARVAMAMLLDAGLTIDELHVPDFDQLHADNPASVELHVDGNMTGGAALDAILGTVGAACWPTMQGILRVARIVPPAGEIVDSFREGEIQEGSIIAEPPRDKERGLPVYRVFAKHSHNYTPSTDIAAAVTADVKALAAGESQQEEAKDLTVLELYPKATDMTIPSRFTSAQDAADEAARVLTMRRIERPRFQVTLKMTMMRLNIDLNNIVGLFHSGFLIPLYGDEDGRKERVLAMNMNTKNRQITYTLWGNDLTARNLATRITGLLIAARDGKKLITRSIG